MQLPTAQLIEILTEAGIRPSAQRLSVLEYLTGTTCHPSADRIYEDVHAMQPTLSRSTVYNTVKLFLDKGVIETVAGDSSECRYDYFHKPHAHFQCRQCRKVYDIPFDMDTISHPGGFDIEHSVLVFTGLCPDCRAGRSEESETTYDA